MKFGCTLVLAIAAASLPALSQDPVRVADIHVGRDSSSSWPGAGGDTRRFALDGRRAFLNAFGSGGREPYVVDPLSKTKVALGDLYPGITSSSAQDARWIRGKIWFTARTSEQDFEPWVSDGTAAGTRRLADIRAGTAGSKAHGFTQCGTRVVFAAHEPKLGSELYVSDGTTRGTKLLVDIHTGATGSRPSHFIGDPAGRFAYFTAWTNRGYALMRSDGTSQGTKVVTITPRFVERPHSLDWFRSKLLFSTGHWQSFRDSRLYLHDGSKTIELARTKTGFETIAVGETHVAFCKTDLSESKALWLSDGTALGTRTIADFGPRKDVSRLRRPTFTDKNTIAYFVQRTDRSHELWFHDVPSGKSRLVWSMPGVHDLRQVVAVGPRIYFVEEPHSIHQTVRLRVSDGTKDGTRIVPGLGTLDVTDPGYLTPYSSSMLLFSGTSPAIGYELFLALPTGIFHAHDLSASDRNAGSKPTELTRLGDRILFSADDGIRGRELWAHEPKTHKTSIVSDLLPGKLGSNPTDLCRLGDKLLFSADVALDDRQLCITDGTTRGTRLLARVNSSKQSLHSLRRVGTTVYFTVGSAANSEIYATDGTRQGTKLFLKMGKEQPSEYTPLGRRGHFVFLAGPKLWVSDGTPRGTKAIATGASGPRFSKWLSRLGQQVAFVADWPGAGLEPGVTDGTAVGTRMIADVTPGPLGWTTGVMTPHGSGAFFEHRPSILQTRTYWTNGTRSGTHLVPVSADARQSLGAIASLGSRRFAFSNYSARHDLFVSDGTVSGTRGLRRIGTANRASPRGFLEFDGELFFSADDQKAGRELWKLPLGAVSLPQAAGCTTRSVTPDLRVEDAVLGQSAGFEVRHAQAGTVLVVLAGHDDRRGRKLRPDCYARVDLSGPHVALPVVMRSSAWSYRMRVPNDRRLDRVSLTWHGVFAGLPSGEIETTNSVRMTIGSR